MALINCTINQGSIQANRGSAIGATSNIVLTITPDNNYVVSAQDFVAQSPPTGISSISISNTTTGYAEDNLVRVTCDLDNSFSSQTDVTFTIDVDGSAVHYSRILYNVNGTHTTTGSNVTISPTTASSWSAQGMHNQVVTVLHKTYTASANHHFDAEPTAVVSNAGNYASNYSVVNSHRQYTNGKLTSVRVNVKYTFPNADSGNHVLAFSGSAVATPDETKKIITNASIESSTFSGSVTRNLVVTGTTSDSIMVATVTRASDSATYDFTTGTFTSASTNKTSALGSGGVNTSVIIFPNSTSNETYNFSVQGGTDTVTTAAGSQATDNTPFTFSVSQISALTFTIDAESSVNTRSFAYTNCGPYALTANTSYVLEGGDAGFYRAFSIAVSDSSNKNLYLRGGSSGSLVNFDNTDPASNGGMFFHIPKFTGTGNGTPTITFSSSLELFTSGVSSVVSSLNTDNLINQAPVASAISNQVQIANNTAANIQLTATDPEGDSLTYSVVSNGSKGSVTINSSGLATYTPTNSSSSGADSFTYKVNDGYEDSNTAQVNVYIAASGGGGGSAPSISYLWLWDDTEDQNGVAIIGNSSNQGTPVINGFNNGATSFTFSISDWDLSVSSGTLPSYVDHTGDMALSYVLKNITDNTTVASGSLNVHTISTTIGSGVAEVYSTSATITPSQALNNNKTYRLELKITYDNISQ